MKRNSPSLCHLALVLLLLLPIVAQPAEPSDVGDEHHPVSIEVDGLGWWQNREQRQSLSRLLGGEKQGTLEANAIEDAAFLLLSALTEQGYLEPVIDAEIVGVDGQQIQFQFDMKLESTLPRSVVAKRVRFTVKKGVRFVLDQLEIEGLQALEENAARRFFVGEAVLIGRNSSRIYSPARLRTSVSNLEVELKRMGYAEALVTVKDLRVDHKTGEVQIVVTVDQGPRWLVVGVRSEGDVELNEAIPSLQNFTGQAWSPLWEQNVSTEIRNHFFHRGYPDATVQLQTDVGEAKAGVKAVAVVARVKSGGPVKVGEVAFRGAKRTAEDVLRRRVDSEPGQLLDPLAMEQARFRLARLGIFETVDLRYEPTTGPIRNPIFTVHEGRDNEANLLFGYGSYEQLRGGVEWRRWNLFGYAHHSRLLLLQSMKSSRGEYSYTVPELFGESLDGTARVFGLVREEPAFLRKEYGANFSVSTHLKWLGANATVGYTFESLSNDDNTVPTNSADESQVNAASVDVRLVRDRRDDPMRPHRGYRWYIQTEFASQYLGGSVDYQHIELGASYHTSMGRGRWIHVGFNHGVVTTLGGTDSDVPVNKLFFPGGDNSIRGYQEGEAAPIAPDGTFVGARSYLLFNLELEQALTTKFSAVIFGDALGTAVNIEDYPFNEELYSVGLGFRYQTLIGPVRLEYGRNLNPRPSDPGGTLLFSVGFPF